MRTSRRTPTDGAQPSTAEVRGRRAHAGPPADEDSGREETDDTEPRGAPTRARSWNPRPRTVRAKVVCLLMVPVVSLLALWAHATVTTAQDVARLRQLQRVDSEVRAPVAATVIALQDERAAAVRYATRPSADRERALKKLAARTDRTVSELRLGQGSTVADSEELPAAVAVRLETFVTGAEQLHSPRTALLDRTTGWYETYRRYTGTIATAFGVGGALTGIQDAEIGSDARVLLEFSRAGEALAQEDAVLAGARLEGTLDGQRLRLFTGAVDTRRLLTDSAAVDLREPERAAWQALTEGAAYADMTAVEDGVLTAPPGATALQALPGETWNAAHARVQDDMRSIEADAGRDVADRADPLRRGLLSPAGAAVLLGLAAMAASLIISVRIGRGLVVELVTLRNSALEIARRKLPNAMRRLRAGEEIDVRAEAPPGRPAEDEAGQVAEALTTVHRAALHAAVERAELAGGISGVFVNLARRSQVLVHRQLRLLDSMERRSEDPKELSDLFRLDHLTTRMRRHAESLIILSGAAPGRAWRMPVPLTNVVRAAVSEIEDYARVEVRQLSETLVVGAAIADLTHLLAEIVENAAQFSPPHTGVRVTGEPVGNGYALEVEDRGLGMGKETLAETNRRIGQSQALDLFDSDRLGLFVVSRLAARQGIKVHLRTSPYGGTTAVILLPVALLHTSTEERSGTRRVRAEEPVGRPPGRTAGRPAEQPVDRAPGRTAGREYARVPGPLSRRKSVGPAPRQESVEAHIRQESVEAHIERPALVSPVAAPAEASADGSHAGPPPEVITLRLHRSSDDDAPSDVPDGLPRRVRQASLAPQLREGRAEEPANPARHRDDAERTPEAVRDRMTAYRAGWARGGGRSPGLRTTSGPAGGRDSSEGDLA
ncbi:nitrate- and nitrite sensing domain-containing protein [Streptomyces sp. BH-SS-21]|uniref:histidine kinase n=1 Tax=Streptomyces liliiviolaceus TaxID=2823109 RepID=A0A941BHI0_9ACTN|nr:nitrate- and nitrite sensing domain-containing protein [Streptomyces liliiviolaceus]MBQ0853844.1 nitrate- and nitrite sensing domain-containing protein [Streptomyces liliiviolaceus]